MAEIIKDREEDNVSRSFLNFNQEIKQQELKKKKIISLIAALIIVACLIGYYLQYGFYYGYFLYAGVVSFLVLIYFLRKPIVELDSYQDYARSDNNQKHVRRGDRGEDEFTEALRNILKDSQFKVLNNLYFSGEGEYLRQIDSLLIGKKNVYVIEVKKWRGLIVGKIGDQEWKVYNGSYESSRRNPYQQNRMHVQDVRSVIGHLLPEESQIYNVVINMERDAIFNVRDKYGKKIYDNWYDLLYWIDWLEGQDSFPLIGLQDKLKSCLLNNHFRTLHNFELWLNKDKLRKFELYEEYRSSSLEEVS
ncbi:nuclease-related domain-containing protein [Fuchsiella alkaliacetigena]|uniref:nuclease-related domain-containing protein n=1 Tax=Fuchsiella alkaliacetigena TaxID=957042 RepID=UPI00200AB207|nr:nuclease-related domain-containing protein [Fuchsiella alkaliacetigena]MCK8825400.1 NERD domain-containing protein [Fuchsiella alkaliacetigena]